MAVQYKYPTRDNFLAALSTMAEILFAKAVSQRRIEFVHAGYTAVGYGIANFIGDPNPVVIGENAVFSETFSQAANVLAQVGDPVEIGGPVVDGLIDVIIAKLLEYVLKALQEWLETSDIDEFLKDLLNTIVEFLKKLFQK